MPQHIIDFRKIIISTVAAVSIAITATVSAESKVSLNDYYRPFTLSEITPENMQKWPYYKHTSTHWDEYGLFGTVPIMAAEKPASIRSAKKQFDIEQDFRNGRSFVDSLTSTQTKGFLVIKDNMILGEFYDNGFSVDQTQLLQSSSKTFAGIAISKLIDEDLIDPSATIDSYLADFKGSAIGRATVQHVLDMQSGLLPANDYHVPGGEAYVFETEQGMKPGKPTGHRKAVMEADTQNAPGEIYNYNDKNTDLLAILAEGVTGQHFNKLLSDMFSAFGANSAGSIALTVDGTASPSYGISMTLRDYGLFHQWVAQGKAPKSFYASAENLDKDKLGVSETGKAMKGLYGTRVAYASQAWIMPEHDIIMTLGSYGQVGFSHLKSGISVVFMQDWEDNGVAAKGEETIARALFVIDQFR
jgi:CubicO group peptidase (beta-lactamase class C family)